MQMFGYSPRPSSLVTPFLRRSPYGWFYYAVSGVLGLLSSLFFPCFFPFFFFPFSIVISSNKEWDFSHSWMYLAAPGTPYSPLKVTSGTFLVASELCNLLLLHVHPHIGPPERRQHRHQCHWYQHRQAPGLPAVSTSAIIGGRRPPLNPVA